MSIAQNYPAISPSLNLSFALTKALDPRITFTRASTATYYGTQTAKAEENLLLQSQDFTTTWVNSNSTDAADTSVAPDGTTTADTLTDNDTAGVHIVSQAPVLIVGAIYTMSCFLKASTNNFALVTLTNGTTVENGIAAVIDLSAGTISETDTGTSATLTSSSITSIGSGWYRVVITGSSVAGFNRAEVGLAPAGTGNTFSNTQRISYTGTGTSIFVWGAQLEQRSAVTAYTPTTTQPITNYIPVLQTAASGVARFDHNPTTFESLGLLIEESRTNLLLYSEELDTGWTNASGATWVYNTAISPAGTQTALGAYGLSGTGIVSTGTTLYRVGTTVSGSTAYTFSVFVRAVSGTLTNVVLRISESGGNSTVSSAFTVGTTWTRISMTVTTGAGATSATVAIGTSISTADLFIWGAQLEAGAFPTSYIPTVASQVTRAADVAVMTGTNFSSWYSQGQGTLYAEFNPLALAASSGVVINDNTTSNRIRLATTSVSDQGTVTTSGTAQAVLDGGTPAANTSMKLAMTYQVNNFALSLNGATAATDTTGTVPVVSQLQIGAETTTVGNLRIKKMAYYPIVSTATQLQALTS
jgi:hypothetical protein